MSSFRVWHAVFGGCGTAASAVAWALRTEQVSRTLRSVLCVDFSEIEEKNRISCPMLGEHDVGRPKAEVLAEVVSAWPGNGTHAEALHQFVEDLDWQRIIAETVGREAPGAATLAAFIFLDSWDSRVTMFRDIRAAAAGCPGADIVVAQIGLDRGRAAVSIFDTSFESTCPACGLAKLPSGGAPCILYNADGELHRGTLVEESREAAGFLIEALAEILAVGSSASRRFVNTKSDIFEADGGFRRLTGSRERVPSCTMAHAPSGPTGADILFGI